jgi:hypothetical protein
MQEAFGFSKTQMGNLMSIFGLVSMTASKAMAVTVDSEDIASNSCCTHLTMNLPVFC